MSDDLGGPGWGVRPQRNQDVPLPAAAVAPPTPSSPAPTPLGFTPGGLPPGVQQPGVPLPPGYQRGAPLPPPPPGAPLPPGYPGFTPPPRSGSRPLIAVVAAVVMAIVVLLLATVGHQTAGTNGESARSGNDIASDAQTAFRSLSSVRVTGTAVTGTETDQIDMYLLADNSAHGTVTANGAVAEIVIDHGYAYVRGAAFWRTFAPSVADRIGDSWVKLNLSSPNLKALAVYTRSAMADAMGATGSGMLGKGSATSINGTQSIPIEGNNGTLWVAVDGKPYPTRFHGAAGTGSATLDFTEYDRPVTATTDPTDFLDLSQ